MKKITSIDEIPQWFHINNYYPILKNLPREKLAYQLRTRIQMFSTVDINAIDLSEDSDYESILKSEPILEDRFESTDLKVINNLKEKYYEVYAHGDGIRLATLGDLVLAGKRSRNILTNLDEYPANDALTRLYLRSLSYDLLDYEPEQASELFFVVQLQYSDEKIIEELAKALLVYRQRLRIDKPKKPVHTLDYYLDKTLSYRLIPMLDILMWAHLNKVEIPERILAVLLGPKGEIGESTISRNAFPLLDKLSNRQSEARDVVLNETAQKI